MAKSAALPQVSSRRRVGYAQAMSHEPLAVTIVTGFLGAGKSTLMEKWLKELPRDETAVIVNERGEVGIDGELLAAHVARLREITGGCVCCSSQAELLSALNELAEAEPRPSRILVETSGAASPSGVIRALSAPLTRERFRLDGVITVLHGVHAREAVAFDVAVEQLGFADVVVLSHVDNIEMSAKPADIEDVQALVQRYAPAALTVRARRWAFWSCSHNAPRRCNYRRKAPGTRASRPFR
jgi:G3E family GTPase